MSGLISLREAANISGYHQDYLSFLIRKNKLHGEKIGRAWCVKEDELKKFLSEKNNIENSNIDKQISQIYFLPNSRVIILFLIAIILFFVILFQIKDDKIADERSRNRSGFVVNTIYSETNSEVSSQTSTSN